MKRELLVLSVLLTACGGPPIRGGAAVVAGQEPEGRLLAVYLPSECADASGRQATWSARLFVVRDADGKAVLVESRPGYDSLLVRNGWVEGTELVYQVAVRNTVREIRVPATADGPGRMLVARRWDEQERVEGGFRANLHGPVLSCKLARAVDTADPTVTVPPLPPAASAAEPQQPSEPAAPPPPEVSSEPSGTDEPDEPAEPDKPAEPAEAPEPAGSENPTLGY